MKSINKNILKSIKAVHVLMICFWLGAVASVVIIFFSTNEYSSKEIISNATGLMENIDIYIIP